MKACDGIVSILSKLICTELIREGQWITAAVQRAVNDKTAQTLLGDSFKRQLKYDGMYSAVSFICTKTDDILVEEVTSACNIEDEIKSLLARAQAAAHQREELLLQLCRLQDEKSATKTATQDLEHQLRQWKGLLSKSEAGQVVFRSDISRKKRKRTSGDGQQCKKLVSTSQVFDSSSDSDDDNSSDDCGTANDQSKKGQDSPPLTREEIRQEIAVIKEQKTRLRQSKKDCEDQIARIKENVYAEEQVAKNARCDAISKSITARNSWSRDKIKEQFAQGVKE